MSPLWIIPSVVTVTGLVVLTFYIRAIGTAADDLRRQFQQMGELRLAVARLRDEAARGRAARVGRR